MTVAAQERGGSCRTHDDRAPRNGPLPLGALEDGFRARHERHPCINAMAGNGTGQGRAPLRNPQRLRRSRVRYGKGDWRGA